ncbi:MAG: class C sortase [Lachnospiraceae bacterium]
MKRKIINLLILLLVLLGIFILAYPYINFWFAERNQSYMIQEYDHSLEQLSAEQIEAEWARAKAYNDALTPDSIYDPFASGRTGMDEEYLSLLNLEGNGIMGSISIPKINVELPVFHGTTTESLEIGSGHMEGSALPIGGEGTHAVLTGHTGLNTAKLFTDLIELTIGDEFYIKVLDQTLAYRVDQILVVEPADMEAIQPVPGEDYVTLVTCTPYGINSHRLLVRGERVDYTPEEIEQRIEEIKPVLSKETLLLYIILALLFSLALIIIAVKRRKRKQSKSNGHRQDFEENSK